MAVTKIHARVTYHLSDGRQVVGDVEIDPLIAGAPERLGEQVRLKASSIQRKIEKAAQ